MTGSASDFRNTVTATNNLCIGGAPVLYCSGSDVCFRGRAQFSGNIRNHAWDMSQAVAGFSDGDSAGGAWNLWSCRVVADKQVGFYNNSAVAVA
jgi:hypothetical protein